MGPLSQEWKSRVGRNVRTLRLSAGISQRQLASDAQIDTTYLSGIERGIRNPSLLVLAGIALALRVPAWLLLSSGGDAAIYAFVRSRAAGAVGASSMPFLEGGAIAAGRARD